MSYEKALIAAGCEIIDFKEVGSYQGEWGAIVIYNGNKCFINGYYGSCSGCDAFEAEFTYSDFPREEDGVYYNCPYTYDKDNIISKDEFDRLNAEYNKRLSDFAQSYLAEPFTKEDVEKKYFH